MDWYTIQSQGLLAYEQVMAWGEANTLLSGMIIGVGIFGSLSLLVSSGGRRMRKQTRLHRILWGAKMRRSRNRLAFEKSSLAMAIEDCLFEMEYQGDITKESADQWRNTFALHYQMEELLPRRDFSTVKRAIKNRLNRGIHLPKLESIIPGGLPAVKVDKTYELPVVTKMKSKFA